MHRQQRIGIGANGIESDIAQIERAGETDHNVQSPAEHHIDEDLHAVIIDPFQRARRPKPGDHDKRKSKERGHAEER